LPDSRDVLTGQAQPCLHLGVVMAGMQHPPPEQPNPLPPQAAEEGPPLQPPGGAALSQLRQTPPREPNEWVEVRPDDGLVAGREKCFNGRLLGAEELGERMALGEKLVGSRGSSSSSRGT
jgi:hypothetical protein